MCINHLQPVALVICNVKFFEKHGTIAMKLAGTLWISGKLSAVIALMRALQYERLCRHMHRRSTYDQPRIS